MENITNIFGKNKSGDGKEKQGQAEASEKPCRACTDFKTWFKMGSKSNSDKEEPIRSSSEIETAQCPLDKDELGHNTWSLLHTMAAYYPERPTPTQQKEMSVFIKLFSKYYPCDHCARDFRQSISTDPPETSDRSAFSQWLCRMHNQVNRKLGKAEFDCKLVDERWKDGWEDGTCG